ncbi:MAG: HNH endonuclease [Alphaproteobacteria bacterium]|nr:HNH endonuclease [Alphaproteobacteria bacterium]
MARKNCIYCDKEITTRSREHVIQNALGGLYESGDICCSECNNYVSKHIDAPFTKIFTPIVGNISNMTKSHNKNSLPVYTGTVSYNGKKYEANIKAGKVVSCQELSRELRCDISKLPLEIESYKFDLDNEYFQTGIAKIAFNYALAMDVNFDLIKPGLNVIKNDNGIAKIEYNYPLVPFCPLNAADTVLELAAPTELYHNLILFSQSSNLWCYIDLFNTFQYYVLLSDQLPKGTDIYHSYAQTLKKIPRPEDIDIFSPKDAMIYAQQYGVEPTMDKAELLERIKNAALNKVPLENAIGKKMHYLSPLNLMGMFQSPYQMAEFAQSLLIYFDDEDNLIKENFRMWTPTPNGGGLIPYPDAILDELDDNPDILKQYTTAKFNKLNSLLINKVK